MRTTLILAVVVAASAASAEPARARISPGLSGLALVDPGSGGAAAQLSLSYHLTRWLEPELAVGLGGVAGGNNDYFNRFAFGLRLKVPTDGPTPFAWVAFAHIHESPASALLENPLGVIFAASPNIAHRSGGEAGLGLTFPIKTGPWDDAPVLEVTTRASAMYLPGFATMITAGPKRGAHLYGQLEVMFGLPFDLSPLRGDV
jgi:hypothetical protein